MHNDRGQALRTTTERHQPARARCTFFITPHSCVPFAHTPGGQHGNARERRLPLRLTWTFACPWRGAIVCMYGTHTRRSPTSVFTGPPFGFSSGLVGIKTLAQNTRRPPPGDGPQHTTPTQNTGVEVMPSGGTRHTAKDCDECACLRWRPSPAIPFTLLIPLPSPSTRVKCGI